MNKKFDKNSKINEVLENGIKNIFILGKYGMKCANCPAKNYETLGSCTQAHNIDIESLLEDLNK